MIEKGSEVFVQRSNRSLFVNSFIRHALHLSAAASVAEFKAGLELLFNGPAVMMCSSGEVLNTCWLLSSLCCIHAVRQCFTWSSVAVM